MLCYLSMECGGEGWVPPSSKIQGSVIFIRQLFTLNTGGLIPGSKCVLGPPKVICLKLSPGWIHKGKLPRPSCFLFLMVQVICPWGSLGT